MSRYLRPADPPPPPKEVPVHIGDLRVFAFILALALGQALVYGGLGLLFPPLLLLGVWWLLMVPIIIGYATWAERHGLVLQVLARLRRKRFVDEEFRDH